MSVPATSSGRPRWMDVVAKLESDEAAALVTPRPPPRTQRVGGADGRGPRQVRARRYSDCPRALVLACAALGPDSQHGAIVLEIVPPIGQSPSVALQAAMQRAIVALPGVISVTTEDCHVLVNTKQRAAASNVSFRQQVMDAVRAQGVEKVTVIAVAGEEGSRRESAVENAVDSSSSGAQQWAFFPATSSQQSSHEGSTEAGSTYREDSTEACLEACPEPRYLDDEDEHAE
ncbi:unnamed protein product, partial [Polarella glacialis]